MGCFLNHFLLLATHNKQCVSNNPIAHGNRVICLYQLPVTEMSHNVLVIKMSLSLFRFLSFSLLVISCVVCLHYKFKYILFVGVKFHALDRLTMRSYPIH